jgi:ABC-type polysaccharide transport system permease subunit
MASAIPLNNFRTIITNVITNANTVYTAPAGVTTVVLMAQVANVNPTQTVKVSASHIRGANNTRLIANAEIPIQDAASLLMGKLVLESGDGFSIQANLNDSAELSLSLLETANA